MNLFMQKTVNKKCKDYTVSVYNRTPFSLVTCKWNEIFLKTLIEICKWTNCLIAEIEKEDNIKDNTCYEQLEINLFLILRN